MADVLPNQFKIDDWYNIHKPYTLNLKTGYTALVGPNGAGKSTLLLQITDQLKERKALYIYFDYDKEGKTLEVAKAKLLKGDPTMLATAMMSSEGEKIVIQFGDTVKKIGGLVAKSKDNGKNEPVYVLLDAVDSGASVDRIRDLRHLFDFILKDATNDVYIIVAGNNYELVKDAQCLDPCNGKYFEINSYDEFADYVCSFFDKHPRKD